jgi:octaprenyl-diphosphate synthase
MGQSAEALRSSDFLTKISDYRVKMDNAIFAELDHRKGSIFFIPLTRAMKGGKRLRPILLFLSFESVNRRKADPLSAAVAVELAHTESLIHDDIIDRDLLRRGTPAFYAMYGTEMALLSADFTLSLILEITARYADPRITRALAVATSRMCEGQLEELRAYKDKQFLSVDEYINIVLKKTASLFEASAMIGAIVGGAVESEVEALSDYARMIGIAYQICDDISDLQKNTRINLLSLSKVNLEKGGPIGELAKSYVLQAKQRLEKLKTSEAKCLLIELADCIISDSFDRI